MKRQNALYEGLLMLLEERDPYSRSVEAQGWCAGQENQSEGPPGPISYDQLIEPESLNKRINILNKRLGFPERIKTMNLAWFK